MDFSKMTIEEWAAYEFSMDYSTIISDVTCYEHEFLRNFLNSHWSAFISCVNPLMRKGTEDQCRKILETHQKLRLSVVPVKNVEESRIYLWPRGKVPCSTKYVDNPGYVYADQPEFEPYMLEMLIEEGIQPKGAVLLASGGNHMFRSNVEEAFEVAVELNRLGYQCFIVNYRVDPYTIDESALDIARAIRFVRVNAEKYGIKEERIACAGFSAGCNVITNVINKCGGSVNASLFVENYKPDELDSVSADMNINLSIYAHHGMDYMEVMKFPPTFFAIGSEDMKWKEVTECFDALRDAGIPTEFHTFAGVPHGFGAGTHADGTVYKNAATWPVLADAFMQDLYLKKK